MKSSHDFLTYKDVHLMEGHIREDGRWRGIYGREVEGGGWIGCINGQRRIGVDAHIYIHTHTHTHMHAYTHAHIYSEMHMYMHTHTVEYYTLSPLYTLYPLYIMSYVH